MKHVLIDAQSLQARQHLLALGHRKRLSSFLEILHTIEGVLTRFSDGLPIVNSVAWYRLLGVLSARAPAVAAWVGRPLRSADLDGQDLLILTTRYRACPYRASEIEAIEAFVRAGGSLWVMANHSRVPGSRMGDFTTQDSRLLSRFGIQTVEACFYTPGGLSALAMNRAIRHHVLLGSRNEGWGDSLVVNNCCAFTADLGAPVIMLNEEMVDQGPNRLRSEGMAFAVTIDHAFAGGRVLATADSGFIGEPGVPASGPGLIDRGGNRQFVDRAIRWLLNET
jgi:hypothetical protein